MSDDRISDMQFATFAALVVSAGLLAPAAAAAAGAPSAADRAFVAKVSQGGMFEVRASKLATDKAVAQNVRDFAVAEVHDHTLVGDKLKAIAAAEGIPVAAQPNAEFSAKLSRLAALSGRAFDGAYMNEMASIHAKDGAAFAAEAANGGSPEFRAFAAETHAIVLRHIGAIHAAPPPAM